MKATLLSLVLSFTLLGVDAQMNTSIGLQIGGGYSLTSPLHINLGNTSQASYGQSITSKIGNNRKYSAGAFVEYKRTYWAIEYNRGQFNLPFELQLSDEFAGVVENSSFVGSPSFYEIQYHSYSAKFGYNFLKSKRHTITGGLGIQLYNYIFNNYFYRISSRNQNQQQIQVFDGGQLVHKEPRRFFVPEMFARYNYKITDGFSADFGVHLIVHPRRVLEAVQDFTVYGQEQSFTGSMSWRPTEIGISIGLNYHFHKIKD